MPEVFRFLCNDPDKYQPLGPGSSRLEIRPAGAAINFDHEKFLRRLNIPVQNRSIDLIEIAAFVYAVDAHVPRGGLTEPKSGSAWRRSFELRIGVRDPLFWAKPAVTESLRSLLSFISEDDFTFEFFESLSLAPRQEQLSGLSNSDPPPDDVVMFSGGLDSLAGASELAIRNKRIALVSVSTSFKIKPVQSQLAKELGKLFSAASIEHFQIPLSLKKNFTREETHRTRTFLFAAVGGVISAGLGCYHLSFFENGVLSLNLPIIPAVVGARATRSTHPKTLSSLSKLFQQVFDRLLDVRNPFLWLTKTDVVRQLQRNTCAKLIVTAQSCANVRGSTKMTPHCGRCSQCVDRRFAVLAAGLTEYDPAEGYSVDLLLGPRPFGPERTLALSYHEFARIMLQMDLGTFLGKYPEAARALEWIGTPTEESARQVFELLKRHAREVIEVSTTAIRQHSFDIATGGLPPDCLLAMISGRPADVADGEPQTAPRAKQLDLEMLFMAIDDRKRGKPLAVIRGVG